MESLIQLTSNFNSNSIINWIVITKSIENIIICRAPQRDSNQGLGLAASNTVPEADDNEYDAYRKRMMLAYRFRPNPLVNSFQFKKFVTKKLIDFQSFALE